MGPLLTLDVNSFPMGKKTLLAIGLVLGVGLIAYWTYSLGLWRFNYPSRAQYPVRGVDVSHHQGRIDWKTVREAGFRFVYIKATEGGNFLDPRFKTNWAESLRSGFLRGAYHYFTFRTPGREQALNFIRAVPLQPGTLPPVIDFEFAGNSSERLPDDKLLDGLFTFADAVAAHYGKRPIVYVTRNSYERYLAGRVGQFQIWIRSVWSRPGRVGDRQWLFWQFGDNTRVPGIEGKVDQNVFRGSVEDLVELTGTDGTS
ncbi:MAG: GH25 family lysozyme [Desulfobacterales bacterium]